MISDQIPKVGPQALINVKVIPRASRNQIVGKENAAFKIKLTAPPVEGKANKALKEFLSKKLRVPKRNVDIISGKRSRQKSVLIRGLSPGDVDTLLKND